MSATTSAVVGMSLFSYAMMAVIAMTTAGLIAALVAGLAAIGRRNEAAAAATVAVAASAPPAADGIDPAVVAAIAAAVRMVASDHRIVWIGEAQPMGGWTSEVRQRHHALHHPHPTH